MRGTVLACKMDTGVARGVREGERKFIKAKGKTSWDTHVKREDINSRYTTKLRILRILKDTQPNPLRLVGEFRLVRRGRRGRG